ncbi:MAG TPA: GntR family transcriptional regulator [Bordetella sp.]|jgi:GntR family transcriptional repressor for pyruvate dehydrogenase complex|nr:GntR family transcriptional regulator [Bordetella sp.]
MSPVKRTSLAQAIAHKLRELIAQRKLQGGDRLPSERDLALALEVSRPAIREGMRLLEGLGIVDVRHGKGIFVLERQSVPLTDLSQLDSASRLVLLRQAVDARRAVDVETARVAAREALPEDLRRIGDSLDAAESEPLASRREFSLDLTFEQLLGEATHNPYLIAVQRVAHQMFQSAWESCGFIPRPAQQRNAQHREIFAAVRQGKEALAASRMAAHFELSIAPPSTAGQPSGNKKSARRLH